jgi:predicted nucleic acid-binding protein
MTVTIELPPEIEAGLLAQAQAEGLGVADYVRKLVSKEIAVNSTTHLRAAYEHSNEEWLREFNDWVNSYAGNSIVLPDEAMERESIYGDHGR